MASNPGADFQDEIRRSIPAKVSGRETWSWKPPDVPQFGLRCRKCHRGILKRRCTNCEKEDAFDPRFTPKHPFDLLVSLPVEGTAQMKASVIPQILFAFELKRTAGKYLKKSAGELSGRLGFKDVKPHQESGLQKVAAGGGVAGILWLVEVDDDAACHFLRIADWLAYQQTAEGASMSLAAARVHGIELEQDVGRGTHRRYWKLAELFRHFGAGVDPTPQRKAARPKPAPLKLFDEPPAEPETLPFTAPETPEAAVSASLPAPPPSSAAGPFSSSSEVEKEPSRPTLRQRLAARRRPPGSIDPIDGLVWDAHLNSSLKLPRPVPVPFLDIWADNLAAEASDLWHGLSGALAKRLGISDDAWRRMIRIHQPEPASSLGDSSCDLVPLILAKAGSKSRAAASIPSGAPPEGSEPLTPRRGAPAGSSGQSASSPTDPTNKAPVGVSERAGGRESS